MIEIIKMTAPPELIELQKEAVQENLSANKAFAKLSGKKTHDLRVQLINQLMQEQGHLCAYCMRRIPDTRDVEQGVSDPLEVKIEHWNARSSSTCGAYGALEYTNMLAVCSGNQNGPSHKKSKLTCDAKRGNRTLTVNPLDSSTLVTISYKEDGTIQSSDKVIDEDLNVGLNLNCMKDAALLPLDRKKALDAIQEEVMDEVAKASQDDRPKVLKAICNHLYLKLSAYIDPKPPYIGIMLWWLKEHC